MAGQRLDTFIVFAHISPSRLRGFGFRAWARPRLGRGPRLRLRFEIPNPNLTLALALTLCLNRDYGDTDQGLFLNRT